MAVSSTWNDRQLPYPVLTPWNDDYGDLTYVASMPKAVLGNGVDLRLTIKHHCTSHYLRGLVRNDKASYCALVVCTRTATREVWETNQEDDVQVVDATQYAEELELRPYIVSKASIAHFVSTEHADEFRCYRPDGFDISPASILAVGEASRIIIEPSGSPHSVIDLVARPGIEPGAFSVDLDEDRIKIHVHPEDKNRIEALRTQGWTSREVSMLSSSVYLHAVVEGLRKLASYSGVRWVRAFRNALERHDVQVDDEEIRNSALKYAQQIMDRPVGTTLRAFTEGRDE